MKTWSAFLKDVRPSAPATPEPVLEHAVMRAAQYFCEQTRAWVVELDPTLTIDGITEYDIELPRDTELVRIESATFNGEPYAVWTPRSRAHGHFVSTPDGRVLRFSRAEAPELNLVLTCSVKPGEGASGIDDTVFARYVRDIAAGAIAGLTGDLVRQQAFEDRCADIRYRLWKGNAAIQQRTRLCTF